MTELTWQAGKSWHLLTDNVDFEGIVDASQIIAHDARVIAAVLGNDILQPQGPPGTDHSTKLPLWFLVVLQPRDVRLGIADARASQSHRAAGGLHHRHVHVVGLVERRRAFRDLVVVVVLRVVLVQIRVQFFTVQMQRSRLGQEVCERDYCVVQRA